LVALEPGTVSAYALLHLQQRGTFFVRPGDEVYAGQVVGQSVAERDLILNVCRTKHLTGHRAAPKGIAEGLAAPRILSLDDAVDYLGQDELLEVTPTALRVRKRELRHDARQRAARAPALLE
jgi:GTP-binding protein